jgi:hypothetical protein
VLSAQPLEPALQVQRRLAVLPVVGFDGWNDVRHGIEIAELPVQLEQPARSRCGSQIRTSRIGVELFQRLDRVALDARSQPLLYDRHKIDQDAVAKEIVNLSSRVASERPSARALSARTLQSGTREGPDGARAARGPHR